MIENLEYLCGGIEAILTFTSKSDKWHDLLDDWATIASSVVSALEDEERNAANN
jgi:hypothetical protein